MKIALATIALLLCNTVMADVIQFDDGTTYTLAPNQQIYITNGQELYMSQVYNSGDVYFRKQQPWAERDYVPTATDDMEVGSHEWCQTYVPWSEGLTFNMITWQRYCDTNNDGVYDDLDT